MPRVAEHMDEHSALGLPPDPHMTESPEDLIQRLTDANPEGRELVEAILRRKEAAGFCDSYKEYRKNCNCCHHPH